MDGTFLGIPYFTMGLLCLGLAALWYVVWPKDRTPELLKKLPDYQPRPAWMEAVLRWFHALVWVLLAAMWWFLDAGQQSLATVSALAAGIMYLAFVATLTKDRQRRKAFDHESTAPSADRHSGG
jgi:Flp pilus assembly protein TadB